MDREVEINKTETNKSATVDAKAQKELDIAKREAKELSGRITQLQTRLDRLEGLGSAASDRPSLELGSSDDGRGPGPGPMVRQLLLCRAWGSNAVNRCQRTAWPLPIQ